MMEHIEQLHGEPFWQRFLNNELGRCSEYVLYIRYSLYYHPHRTMLRALPYVDVGNCSYTDEHVWYVSCHWHLTKQGVGVYNSFTDRHR